MSEREWTADEVDDQPGYGSTNLAAYRCESCDTVIPVTFTSDTDQPPAKLPHYGCGEVWDGCGNWGPMKRVETVRWGADQ